MPVILHSLCTCCHLSRDVQQQSEQRKETNSVPPYGGNQCVHPVCYLGFTVPHSIPSRPNQRPINVEPFQAQLSIQIGRINREPSQATASKHWSPHSVRVKVGVRVRVGWYLHINLYKQKWVYALLSPYGGTEMLLRTPVSTVVVDK